MIWVWKGWRISYFYLIHWKPILFWGYLESCWDPKAGEEGKEGVDHWRKWCAAELVVRCCHMVQTSLIKSFRVEGIVTNPSHNKKWPTSLEKMRRRVVSHFAHICKVVTYPLDWMWKVRGSCLWPPPYKKYCEWDVDAALGHGPRGFVQLVVSVIKRVYTLHLMKRREFLSGIWVVWELQNLLIPYFLNSSNSMLDRENFKTQLHEEVAN